MGVSTDGSISFGIMLAEGVELPWDTEEFDDDDIEEWWLKQTGFTLKYEEARDNYFTERTVWENDHPIPVELVNYCSGDYPIWILAVPSSVKTCNRGYPLMIDPYAMLQLTQEEINGVLDFCKEYSIETDGEYPGWYLSSYWG